MKITQFFNNTKIGFILKNLLLAAIVGIVLILILLYWLNSYTEHGIEIEVPNITGMYTEEATPILQNAKLKLVVVDSTYSNKVPLGTIVEQTPPALSHAKTQRCVYVTVNAKNRRQVVLPDLLDVSYRQAQATLRQLGIDVEDVEYEPSEFKDLVLDIKYNDESLPVGAKLEEGSKVIMVVGYGRGTEEVVVPNLHGLTVAQARKLLLNSYLTLGSIQYDEEMTAETAEQFVVYHQVPSAGEMLLMGLRVNIYLSTDLEKAVIKDETQDDESFF